jgi:predicted site-specific integrase-resolvase
MNDKLLTDDQLASRLDTPGVTKRTIVSWRRAGLIPFIKLGYRTYRYDLERVLTALGRREVKAVATRGGAAR